jgi:hypothetical protein
MHFPDLPGNYACAIIASTLLLILLVLHTTTDLGIEVRKYLLANKGENYNYYDSNHHQDQSVLY